MDAGAALRMHADTTAGAIIMAMHACKIGTRCTCVTELYCVYTLWRVCIDKYSYVIDVYVVEYQNF